MNTFWAGEGRYYLAYHGGNISEILNVLQVKESWEVSAR